MIMDQRVVNLGANRERWAHAQTTAEREIATGDLILGLHSVNSGCATSLTAGQRSILYGILKDADILAWPTHRDVELVVAVVEAVAVIGDSRAAPLMTRLAESCRQPDVRETAKRCLPELEARVSRQSGRGRLLSPAVTLVRSALRPPDTRLLQAAEPPKREE